MKGLIFLFCACVILLFSIINLSVGPVINKKLFTDYISVGNSANSVRTRGNSWGTYNCKLLYDFYDEYEETNSLSENDRKNDFEWKITECQRKKAMHDMEYTSFIFNIVFGFVCSLLGLLHQLDVKKEFVPKTGLIGLGCGFVGFIFTFVYLVYNGIVYTNYFDIPIAKRDSGGVYAEKIATTTDQFRCLYYEEQENYYSVYAKFNDLSQKQYNYDKDIYKSVVQTCIVQNDDYRACAQQEIITVSSPYSSCENLYAPEIHDVENKDKSDRFLTTLLLSLFVCLAHIGLALIGFLLYRTPGEF